MHSQSTLQGYWLQTLFYDMINTVCWKG